MNRSLLQVKLNGVFEGINVEETGCLRGAVVGAGGDGQCAVSGALVGGSRGLGPTGRAPVVVPVVNPTYWKPGCRWC